VDFAKAEQLRLKLPEEEFDEVKEHFFCNMDEPSLPASNGTVRVIKAATSKPMTEKQDNEELLCIHYCSSNRCSRRILRTVDFSCSGKANDMSGSPSN
jgi:hypothetical protein